MATSLLNRAQISYTFNGSAGSAVSNQTNTTLLDQYTMVVTKDTLTPEVRAGNNAAYVVRVENNGSGNLYNIKAVDDLGSDSHRRDDPLTYVEGSAVFYLNGTEVEGTVRTRDDSVIFKTDAVLEPQDNLLIIYLAEVDSDRRRPIRNTVCVTAHTGSADTDRKIKECDSAVVRPVCYASVSIFKTADKDVVTAGDELTYTFTLMNTGYDAVDSIVFTDELPEEFEVTRVSYRTNDTTTVISPDDYTIEDRNTLVIPADCSSLVIGVPAATEKNPGITTITVTGVIS